MKILELFCGTKSISKVFKERGHKVFTIDLEQKFNPDLCKNILDLKIKDIPKEFRNPCVIWASPPCTCFSVCAIGDYWHYNLRPKNHKTFIALAVVHKTLELIKELKPKYYFIENPRGVLRKIDFMQRLSRKTVTYCQYGDKRQKPTDIWNNCLNWIPKKKCLPGANCHEASPRGTSTTGTQGLNNAVERGVIPRDLCLEICLACENNNKEKQELIQ